MCSFSLTSKWTSFLQLPGDAVGLGVAGHVVVRRAGDNQRRPRLVDQDVVHFVDDGEVQRALRLLIPLLVAVVALGRRTHVVAEIVEAELVVRAVGDVAVVGLLAVVGLHVALDRADGQAQRHVERAHPFHVAAGEIVVDRDHVNALAFQGVQIGRQGGDQRLSFAGDHFGDVAAMEHDAAHQLHVVVAQAEHAAAGLAADGERLDQQVVERFACGQPLAELDRLLPQLGVGHRLVFRLQGVDGVDRRLQLLEISGVRGAEQAGDAPFDRAGNPAENMLRTSQTCEKKSSIFVHLFRRAKRRPAVAHDARTCHNTCLSRGRGGRKLFHCGTLSAPPAWVKKRLHGG